MVIAHHVRIRRTERFQADVRRLLVVDLASKNPFAADRYLSLLDDALRATARFPYSKQIHPSIGDHIRKILIAPYVVLYCIREDQLVALRFLHTHQDITAKLLRSGE